MFLFPTSSGVHLSLSPSLLFLTLCFLCFAFLDSGRREDDLATPLVGPLLLEEKKKKKKHQSTHFSSVVLFRCRNCARRSDVLHCLLAAFPTVEDNRRRIYV